MIPADERFGGTFPFAPHFVEAAGFRMHYVDEGPRSAAETLVLLHGEPTWGYLYRRFIPPLARRHRVVVPDHMGFGKSDTPQDRTYLAGEHIDNLEALLLALDLRNVTLVLHDWGGPIGTGFALRHPDRVKRLFLMNTLVPLGLPGEAELLAANTAESDWFRWAKAAHDDGTLEQVLGNAHHTVAHLMLELQGIVDTSVVDRTWIAAYAGHFRTREACRGVIRFPAQIVAPAGPPLPAPAAEAVAAVRAMPAMLAEGMHDRALLPRYFIPLFRVGFPDAPVVELDHAGHFCQEDQPETLIALIEQFVRFTA